MKSRRSHALFACVTLLSGNHVLAACESAAGGWSAPWPLPNGGQFNYNWQLSQGVGGVISGSLNMDIFGTMAVTGQFYGNGQFTVHATPQSNPGCYAIDYVGTVNKPSSPR